MNVRSVRLIAVLTLPIFLLVAGLSATGAPFSSPVLGQGSDRSASVTQEETGQDQTHRQQVLDDDAWEQLLNRRVSLSHEDLSNDQHGDYFVRDYIAALRAEHPELNVFLVDRSGRAGLTEFEFKELPIRAALLLLEEIAIRDIEVDIKSRFSGDDVDMVLIRGAPRPSVDDSERRLQMVARAFAVKPLVEAYGEEALLEAFTDGFGFVRDVGPEVVTPTGSFGIRFHAPTGLLFVKGNQQQVDFVEDMIGQLFLSIESSSGETDEQLVPVPNPTDREDNTSLGPGGNIDERASQNN